MTQNDGADHVRENADYVGRMALELARISERCNFSVLMYLFSMAAAEAADLQASHMKPAKPLPPSGQRVPRKLPNSGR